MFIENQFYTGLNNVLFASLNIGAAAVALANIPDGAKMARVRLIAAGATKTAGTIAMRYRADGVDPSSSVGFPIYADEAFDIRIGELSKIKFISGDANTQVLNINFYA